MKLILASAFLFLAALWAIHDHHPATAIATGSACVCAFLTGCQLIEIRKARAVRGEVKPRI